MYGRQVSLFTRRSVKKKNYEYLENIYTCIYYIFFIKVEINIGGVYVCNRNTATIKSAVFVYSEHLHAPNTCTCHYIYIHRV